jgi:hypothetical protein
MYKIYYLPEGIILDEDHMAIASDQSCSQIIVGHSDIVKDYVNDFSKEQIIFIPEEHRIYLNDFSFKENEQIKVLYLNEWALLEPIESIKFSLYMIDFDNPKKLHHIEDYDPEYDEQFKYTKTISVENFGEYILEVEVDGQVIGDCDFIVYKSESNEDNNGPRFEL